MAKTEVANHCWLPGLKPDTEYTYKVFVKNEEWAAGERWDWSAPDNALVQAGNSYDNRFCTNPDPTVPAGSLSFAVMGDFGVGVKRDSPTRRQQKVANAIRRTIDTQGVRLILTTGDNIYAGTRLLGIPIGGSGDEDDDWFFTYFQPYRYVINRVPVFPSIGNHDADETEERDDRAQVEDNFYLRERLSGGEEAAGRASFCPGCSTASVTGPTSSSCALIPRRRDFSVDTARSNIPSTGSLSSQRSPTIAARAHGGFRFATIPRMRRTCSMGIRRYGAPHPAVRARWCRGGLFRARAQLPAFARRWDPLFRDWSGRQTSPHAARSLRRGPHGDVGDRLPFSAGDHRGDTMRVRAIGEADAADQDPVDITLLDPRGRPHLGPMEIMRA